MHEFIPHVKLSSIKFYFHVGNIAHGTLGHVMAAQAMWLNIQCQQQSNLILSKTNVQYENILFYFNLSGVHGGWKGNIGLCPG